MFESRASHSKLMSIADAADELAVSEHTIRSWILGRKLEFVKVGRRVLIKEQTIARLIEDGTVPAERCRRTPVLSA